jgi:DNA topoisomerase-1
MGKSLVIVESPAKAKTINKYLGNNFVVKSSVGHIRDLPTAGSGKTTDPRSAPRRRRRRARCRPAKRRATRNRRPANSWCGAWASTRSTAGRRTTRSSRARKKWFPSCASWRTRPIPSTWRRTSTARARRSPGTCARPSAAMTSATSAWCSTRSPSKAIEEAFAHPSRIDQARVNAQQARRFPRSGRRLHGVAAAVGQGGSRPVRRSRAVRRRAPGGGARA